MTDKFNPRDMAQLDDLEQYIKNANATGPFFYETVVNAVPALIEEVKRLREAIKLVDSARCKQRLGIPSEILTAMDLCAQALKDANASGKAEGV